MEHIKREDRGAVAVLTISRPEAMNALNSAVLTELRDMFRFLAKESDIRAVVLTGEGKAFVAGADIGEMKDFDARQARAYAEHGGLALEAIEALPQPVIAAVNGFALGGGCELALACDIRLASEKAKFGQPEVGLGITPGFGGTQRLPRAIGESAAMVMILTGRTIGAEEALRLSLVQAVHAPEALLDAAVALAEEIAKNAPFAVRAAKRAIRAGHDEGLYDGIAGEGEEFALCFDTQDQKMAMEAFVQKRKPDGFKGK